VAKPKQQSFSKGNASAGKMNEREIVNRNPSTPFGLGFTAPAQSGASSTSNPTPKSTPKTAKYKGRTITAEPDISRVQSGGKTIPLMVKPKAKKVNKRND
jgi:hypothetical protein